MLYFSYTVIKEGKNIKKVEKCIKCGSTKNSNFEGMCKACYEKSINATIQDDNKKDIKSQQSNNILTIFKEKCSKETIKTIAIVVLVLLLVACMFTDDAKKNVKLSHQVDNLTAQISQLNAEIESNNNELRDSERQIAILKSEKDSLQQDKSKLEEEKLNLEKEKNELNTKVEELQKTSTISQTQMSSGSTTSSNTRNNSNSSGSSAKTYNPSSVQNTNSAMVWVGNTGTKYHKQTCRTLKGNGHQITMQQALSEGRTACKVCY